MKTKQPLPGFFAVILVLIAAHASAQFPCISQFSTTNNGNGSFYFASNSYMYGAQSYSGGYTWDFGDGRTDYTYNGPNGVTQAWITQGSCVPYVTHQYISNGTFVVTLYAHYWNTNDDCVGVSTDTIVVSGLPCPHPQIQTAFINDSTFLFTGVASSGTTVNTSYWSVHPSNIPVNSNTDTLLMSFSTGTSNTVCYHVSGTCDGNSYDDSICSPIYVPPLPNCHASFVMYQDSSNIGSWFAYNTSTGTNLSYYWEFGDSTASTQPYPFHTYAIPGHYNICLTVSNDSCSSMYCDTSSVHRLSSAGMMSSFNVLAPVGIQQATGVSGSPAIAPNPFEDRLGVIFYADKNQTVEIILYDALGQKVLCRSAGCMAGENHFDLDTHELGKGMYSLVMTNEAGWCKTVKVLK